MLAFNHLLNLEQISTIRRVSAAVLNISGRQRMLCQRAAFLSLRLVCSQTEEERQILRASLLDAIHLMETSHYGLIYGDTTLHLPNQLSPTLKTLYFEAPFYLDQQVKDYISTVKALAQDADAHLTPENVYLQSIIAAASSTLLSGLDAVVSQYQTESEAEQLKVDLNQITLYQQSCEAAALAEAKTQELENTLQNLQQTQAKLLHSEKMASLGQLMASVAHELNNPVSFIYGNLNHAEVYTQDLLHILRLYQEYYPNPIPELQEQIDEVELDFMMEDLPKMLCSMQIGADRMRQIVKSLRHFSRRDDTKINPVNLHEGLDSTLLILQNRLKAHANCPTIEIIKDYGNIPLVECYSGQLNQVFMNLLSNAIDALEEKIEASQTLSRELPRILIKTERQDSDFIKVRIIDNGPGISSDIKTQIFEQFFTTKTIGKGTGLGLYICYEIIVENHGGKIGCESQEGEGTEFWIALPIRYHHAAEPLSVTPLPPVSATTSAN